MGGISQTLDAYCRKPAILALIIPGAYGLPGKDRGLVTSA